MIHTKFNGYSQDGRRTYHKGGIIASVVNIVLDVVAPPVGAAMHAVMAVKSAVEGNILGAVGNAFGAYSVGGGFSEGGFGSSFGGDAAAGAGGALGDAPMSGMWADPEAAAGGWWGGGAGEIAGGVESGYSGFGNTGWMDTGSGINGDAGGDFGFEYSDTTVPAESVAQATPSFDNFSADVLPTALDASTPTVAAPTPAGPDIFQSNAPDSAFGSNATIPGNNVNSLDPLSQNMGTGLNASPYIDTTSTAYGTPDVASGTDNLGSIFNPTTDTGGGVLDTTATTLDSNASLGDAALGTSSNSANNVNWTTTGGDTSVAGQLPEYSAKSLGGTGSMTPAQGTSPTTSFNSGAGATMSATAPSMWDKLSGYATDPKNFGTMLKGAGTLYGMQQQKTAADALANTAAVQQQKQDVFAEQRPQYQAALSQSYVDPMAVYNSPQYQGLNDIFQKQIARRDAAMGRNSQYGARAIEQQNNFMDYLNKYRAGLLQPAGANIAPSSGSTGLQAQIASQNYASNIPRQLGAAYQDLNLGSLFGG